MKKGAEKSKAAITEGVLQTTDFLSEVKKDFGKSGEIIKTKFSETGKDLKENAAEIKKKSGGFLSKIDDILSGKAKDAQKSVEETVDSTKTDFAVTKHEGS